MICVKGGKSKSGKWVAIPSEKDRNKLAQNVKVGTRVEVKGDSENYALIDKIWEDKKGRSAAFTFKGQNHIFIFTSGQAGSTLCFSATGPVRVEDSDDGSSGFVNKTSSYIQIDYTIDDIKSGKATAKIGDKGETIKELQKMVGAKPDGYYGPNTMAKVKEYQKTNNFTVSGKIDSKTLGGGKDAGTVNNTDGPVKIGCKGDCKNGQGTYTWKSGGKYVGEFKDGKKHNQGTHTYSGGDKYVGEFKDGKRNGQGTYTYTDGDKYGGGFKDGKRSGKGTFIYADGDKYVGEWKDGERHGQGTYTNPKEPSKNRDGEWVDGIYKEAEITENYNINNIKELQETGLSLKTILSFSENQILTLSKKLQEDALSDLTREKADALEKMEDSNADLAKINADIQTATDQAQEETNESEEVEDVDNMGNPEWEQTDNGRVKQGLLDGEEVEIEDDLYEQLFGDDTGNAASLDTPSFHNPDAEGFQSQGPMDSYGEFDGEGGVGIDEVAGRPAETAKYDLFKKVKNKMYGLVDDIKEDTEEIDVGDASKGEYTQTPTQQQAPDGMGDGGDPGSRGMGNESVQYVTKKTIMEVAVSKAQKRMFCFALDCKKTGDCGEGDDVKKVADSNTIKELKLMCNTSDKGLPEKIKKEQRELDNFIIDMVEKYERPSFSKEELIDTVKESLESLESPTIAPSRPTTIPITRPKKPGIQTPYKPKHKPKPKAEDTEQTQLPSWLEFDNIFTPAEDEVDNINVS